MTRWRVVSTATTCGVALLIVFVTVAASGAGSTLEDGVDGSSPTLQDGYGPVYVNESFAVDVFLEGDAVVGDPDAAQFGDDVDGVTYLSSGRWMTVGVDVYAPWSGFFSVCVYPWSAGADTTDYQCQETGFLLTDRVQTVWIDEYVNPIYAGGDYVFYVFLWENTGVDYEVVDWVDFLVVVDHDRATVTPWEPTPVTATPWPPTVTWTRVPATSTPWVTVVTAGQDPATPTPRPAVDTTRPEARTAVPTTPLEDRTRVTARPGIEAPDSGPGTDERIDDGGDEGADSDETVDRGPDVLHPDNVALMMLVVAIVSLLIQLLRRP
jgi:hypothetical protein